jgi:hypothetical protein
MVLGQTVAVLGRTAAARMFAGASRSRSRRDDGRPLVRRRPRVTADDASVSVAIISVQNPQHQEDDENEAPLRPQTLNPGKSRYDKRRRPMIGANCRRSAPTADERWKLPTIGASCPRSARPADDQRQLPRLGANGANCRRAMDTAHDRRQLPTIGANCRPSARTADDRYALETRYLLSRSSKPRTRIGPEGSG